MGCTQGRFVSTEEPDISSRDKVFRARKSDAFANDPVFSALTLAAALVVISCGVGVAGIQSDEAHRGEIEEHSAQAAAAMQKRDFSRAEKEWQNVITRDPGSPQAYNNLGIVYYLEHKYPEAELAFTKALQLDPKLVDTRVLLGASLERQRKLEPAIAELERGMKSRLSASAERTGRMALYEAWVARENYDKALESLSPLIGKYPRDPDILYELGQTHLQLAAQYFRTIALIDPESYRVHQILAEYLTRLGEVQYRHAIQEYKLALQHNPDLPRIHYKIGLLMMSEHVASSDDQAILEFETELRINPYDSWSEYRLGQIYTRKQDAQRASAHFLDAIKVDQSFVPPRLSLALLLERQGKLADAEDQLKVAEKLDPERTSVHYQLARVYRLRGNQTLAEEELKKFQEIQSERLESKQQLQRAIRVANESQDEDPD